MTLRTATTEDADAVADVLIASRRATYRGMLPDAYLDEVLATEVRDDRHGHMPAFASGQGRVLVAEEDGTVIAFIALFEPDEDGSVYVGNLHALPDRKGRGTGTALLDAGRAWAKARGARAMHLLVLDANVAAARFYEARGWHCAGRHPDTMAGIEIVALRYELALRDASSPTG